MGSRLTRAEPTKFFGSTGSNGIFAPSNSFIWKRQLYSKPGTTKTRRETTKTGRRFSPFVPSCLRGPVFVVRRAARLLGGAGFLRDPRPRVAERDRAVEDERPRPGVLVDAE